MISQKWQNCDQQQDGREAQQDLTAARGVEGSTPAMMR
jgi:hypothetical protein